ncbi:MAG: DegQ family serine endoprotease [Mariprofundaceae bacterium]|nr:DegQ family serine endoprotease [Mariprofundaceae bacterium]
MMIQKNVGILLILLFSWGNAQAMPNSFADLVAAQKDTVVNISTTQKVHMQPRMMPQGGQHSPFDQFFKDFFGQMPEQEKHALGTGFIVSSKGYIVTNNHVIEGADEIVVKTSNGKEYKATVMGADAKLDVALLKIKAKHLHAAKLGDSKKLRVGDWVIAIGNPFGLEQTVTAGIVSARGRVIGSGPYDDYIQTDAAINPGNSGGPLFNTKGEVVGINAAIYTKSGGSNGIGFAIPINLAHSVFEELRKTGHVQRARLGVMIRDVDEETMQALGLKSKHGALVPQVQSGSAAEKAGIQAGDVIVGIDKDVIKNAHDLPIRIARHHPGDKVMVHIIRDGHTLHIPVIVEKMIAEGNPHTGQQKQAMRLGLALSLLDKETRQKLETRVDYGLLVKAVRRGSPAMRAGIQRGDVLYKVNGQPIRKISDLSRIVNKMDAGGALRVMMDRHGNQAFTVIRLPKKEGK